jgi:hypothetical protein
MAPITKTSGKSRAVLACRGRGADAGAASGYA